MAHAPVRDATGIATSSGVCRRPCFVFYLGATTNSMRSPLVPVTLPSPLSARLPCPLQIKAD